jgi:hypothetical protein
MLLLQQCEYAALDSVCIMFWLIERGPVSVRNLCVRNSIYALQCRS